MKIPTSITKSTLRSPGFYQMPQGMGHYFVRLGTNPPRVWGQVDLILFLTNLSVRWAQISPGRQFGLGDLAREDGGFLSDHESHSTGMAADIYLLRTDNQQRIDRHNMTTWFDPKDKKHFTPETLDKNPAYDRERTLKLVRLIAQMRSNYPMNQILFDDPVVREAVPGIETRKDKPHHEHIHVLLNGGHPYSQPQVDMLLTIRQAI